MKTIESGSTTLDALLNEVEQSNATVQVLRGGRPVAEVRPIAAPRVGGLPPINPRLKPVLSPDYDPVAGIDEEDWPADMR
ncbi:MAG: hypothetical protein WBD40_25485 [Tepidisphaeraceae bacterium]